MNQIDVNERQRELTDRLRFAAVAYYGEDREVMSNLEYDRLYDELINLEEKSGIILNGSPTQPVGYEVVSALPKVTHPSPMLSLSKTKDLDELESWLDGKDGILSYKLDGLTVALTYEGGQLLTAVTRGNGTVGEDVTNNAWAFSNLPIKIPFKGRLILRGEALIRYSDFIKINNEIADTDAKYKNPRNLASGSVRQLDSAETAKRYVRFYAFALVSAEGEGLPAFTARAAQMDFLRVQGFETVTFEKFPAEALKDIIRRFSEDVKNRDFDLPVDGLVLGFDDIAYASTLGATSKFPRDAIAFKWQDEEAETKLLEVEWSTSRTGLINPIAVFDPIELEGTTVSRASVHNVSILEGLALGAGDAIKVYKANMIIPQISENLTRSGTIKPPGTCPVCGAPTVLKENDGTKTLFCTNEDCPARRLKAFVHFVDRPALDIEGLSEATLEKLISAGLLHELADIFKLKYHRDEIVAMDGFGEKSFVNLTAAIEAARKTTQARLIKGLGLPEVGASLGKVISKHFGYDWDKIQNAGKEDLSGIEGIGDIIIDLYTKWFADPVNRSVVNAVVKELEFEIPASDPAGNGAASLEGKTFVITGSLVNYTNRDELKDKIASLGGKNSGSVSAKTDYLINNDAASGSSKNKAAKSLGVKIITEAEFEAML
jgi:DNA ligase (NAD+)